VGIFSGQGSGSLSGVTVTGTAASGQVPVASSSAAGAWAYPPGFEIGYDQITASQACVSTTEATGTTVITCAAHTFDGGPVIATFFSPSLACAIGAAAAFTICLFEGATEIGRLALVQAEAATNNQDTPGIGMLRFTPTAASHTYTVTGFVSTGTGTVVAGLGGTAAYVPAFIRFTKV